MKEIDFLPEWYKENKRCRLYMRRQCIALGIIFLAMMTYNLMATHRTARATAELARFEDERIKAESVLHQFNMITKELNEVRARADVAERIDSKINVAAVLAEMSHIIGATIVLSRVEFTSEPISGEGKGQGTGGSGVRAADNEATSSEATPLGDAKFRILLAGQAASPADVATLVCRLGDSLYFREVSTSFWRNSRVRIPARTTKAGAKSQTSGTSTEKDTIAASEFEIVCYLANYEEVNGL